jgi:hypothetical protein
MDSTLATSMVHGLLAPCLQEHHLTPPSKLYAAHVFVGSMLRLLSLGAVLVVLGKKGALFCPHRFVQGTGGARYAEP